MGNYTAAFPGTTTPEAFECVRRSLMIMKRSITMASAAFIDVKQVKQADIDLVRNTVNQYYNRLMAEGKIVYGQCFFDPAKPRHRAGAGPRHVFQRVDARRAHAAHDVRPQNRP